MIGVRERYRAGRSSSRPSSSGSTVASTSSTTTPHISRDVPLASSLLASHVATPVVAFAPTLVVESSMHPSSHSGVGPSTSESPHVIEQDDNG